MVLDGIAKPTPVNSPTLDSIAVFIPIKFPLLSNNGPPEFPGLIAASVWIIFEMENPRFWFGSNLPVWLTIPVVIVLLNPKGLPIAITWSPILICDESANNTGAKDSLE